jgi:hypothetical protein
MLNSTSDAAHVESVLSQVGRRKVRARSELGRSPEKAKWHGGYKSNSHVQTARKAASGPGRRDSPGDLSDLGAARPVGNSRRNVRAAHAVRNSASVHLLSTKYSGMHPSGKLPPKSPDRAAVGNFGDRCGPRPPRPGFVTRRARRRPSVHRRPDAPRVDPEP